jgi:hypothetical protein
MNRVERYRGSLLGLAAGDALGSSLEFSPPGDGTARIVEEMVGGGPFDLAPGEWRPAVMPRPAMSAQSGREEGGRLRYIAAPRNQFQEY